jgi:DNA repair exonuclease SbcCD nuclease subunit
MYYLIGDVHLGKKFKSKDIPLNRRGEREKRLTEAFVNKAAQGVASYNRGEVRGIIQMGDLFDSFCVSYEDLATVHQIISYVELNHVPMYIIRGNHDVSKDLGRLSAFSMLSVFYQNSPYIHFITKPTVLDDHVGKGSVLIPYTHGEDLAETVEPYRGIRDIYGHFGEDNFDMLRTSFAHVYTGHIHKPREEGNLTVVGSIMPLTFGEDETGEVMKTCTLAEYEKDLADGVTADRCYRIKLAAGEELPAEFDCIQMSALKEEVDSEDEDLTVEFDAFDIEKLMHEALDSVGLFDEVYKLYTDYKLSEIAD